MEETIVSEGNFYIDDVPRFLAEYQLISLQLSQQGDFASALEALSHSEELLEAVSSQGGYIDPKFIICTLHNMSICYLK